MKQKNFFMIFIMSIFMLLTLSLLAASGLMDLMRP